MADHPVDARQGSSPGLRHPDPMAAPGPPSHLPVDPNNQCFQTMDTPDSQYFDSLLQGIETNLNFGAEAANVAPDMWSPYGGANSLNAAAGLLNPPLNQGPNTGLSDSSNLFQMYPNWGAPYQADKDFVFRPEPTGVSQFPGAHLDEYLASLSQPDSNSTSGSESGPYVAGAPFISSNPSPECLLGGFDVSKVAESGRESYADAMSQWNSQRSDLNSSASITNPFSSHSVPSSPTYEPFGTRDVFQPPPQENSNRQHDMLVKEASGGKPRITNTSSSAAIHQSRVPTQTKPSTPIQTTYTQDNPPKTTSAPSVSPVQTKPSYSDVAKNIPGSVPSNVKADKKTDKCKLDTESYKYQDGSGPSFSHGHGGPHHHGHHHSHHGRGSHGRRSRAGRPHMTRSKSVPFEPATINPNSRYGLDTFEDHSAACKEDEGGRGDARQSREGVISQSRKGSGSSVGSGSLNGLEEVAQKVNASRSTEARPSKASGYDLGAGDVKPGNKDKLNTASTAASVREDNKVQESQAPKRPRSTSNSSDKGQDQHVFFDPKRIFATKKSVKKSGSAAEAGTIHADNCKPCVPNNQQNAAQKKGYGDTVLNNGKPKNSYASSYNINQSCYINNDLREPRKQTNTEASNSSMPTTASKSHDQSGPSRTHHDQDRLSHDQSKRSHAMNDLNGSRSSNSSQRKRHDHERKKREEFQTQGPRTAPKKTKRDTEGHNIIADYVLKLWTWLCWAVPEVAFILWNLLKLVLRLLLLLLMIGYRFACLGWDYLRRKVFVYFSFSAYSSASSSSSSGHNNGRSRSHGLKENITLPATGEDAMKRLLACKGKDPYSILGLRNDVTDDEIKRYYRKQAVLVHPDKNQQPGAEEAFKILGHAFELVGEADKRRMYDAQRVEDQETEKAMQEFGDLLTKLHEKMQEAANLMRCEHCGGKHRRIPVDRPTYSARACVRCNINHPAREGDVWAESRMLGFLWHYYACMEGKVYDITEWASCQRENFQHIQANAHHVIYRISTNANRCHHQSGRGTSKEAELEEFLSNLFHNGQKADIPNGGSAPGGSGQGYSGNSSKPQSWAGGAQSSGNTGTKKAGGRRRKRKH